MRLKDFVTIMNRLVPPDLAEDWDNCGLAVGDPERPIGRIGLTLDATEAAVAEARRRGCDLLLTHHPLNIKPFKKFESGSGPGAVIKAALAADLAIFAAHTNWDAAAGGVADALADVFEFDQRRPLAPGVRDFYKLVVFVPQGYETPLRQALFEIGAGTLGDYERCWFAVAGEGGYRVPVGGRPFIGQEGREAQTGETRLELILPRSLADRAAEVVWSRHPYEEPAFEFQPIKVLGRNQGLGLLGSWSPGRYFLEMARRLSPRFKWAGPRPGRVSTVALVPGSGGSFLGLARSRGAEVLVTGDVDHHLALEAEGLGMTVVDMGHFETEWPGVGRLARRLGAELARLGLAVECQVLPQTSPWRYFGD